MLSLPLTGEDIRQIVIDARGRPGDGPGVDWVCRKVEGALDRKQLEGTLVHEKSRGLARDIAKKRWLDWRKGPRGREFVGLAPILSAGNITTVERDDHERLLRFSRRALVNLKPREALVVLLRGVLTGEFAGPVEQQRDQGFYAEVTALLNKERVDNLRQIHSRAIDEIKELIRGFQSEES